MKYLVVVDMQKDFVDGALGTKEAQSIVPNVVKAIQTFSGTVLYTKDTHSENYLHTQEGHHLPVVHCVKGTAGWELDPQIAQTKDPASPVFEKETFGSTELAVYLQQKNKEHAIEEIIFVGLCTDICVISNAFLAKAFMPEVPITVWPDCCAGVTPESHKNALEAMKMCQINTALQIFHKEP